VSDIDVLESVLAKDESILAAVRPDQLAAPTRCPDYDVRHLMNHIVGWLQVFDASAAGRTFDGDPGSFVSEDPAADFDRISASLIAAWRQHGVDRTVQMTGGELPAQMVLSMSLIEYLAHGCDLASATGQAVPFTDDELAVGLERAERTLPDQYRGEGKPFGRIVDVPESAPVLDRFLGFMGRAA
jgi:uncharacterized protein (TIGR03086 family)